MVTFKLQHMPEPPRSRGWVKINVQFERQSGGPPLPLSPRGWTAPTAAPQKPRYQKQAPWAHSEVVVL